MEIGGTTIEQEEGLPYVFSDVFMLNVGCFFLDNTQKKQHNIHDIYRK